MPPPCECRLKSSPDGEVIDEIIASTMEPERLEEVGAFFEQMDVHQKAPAVICQ